jgi:hypothetical protein
MSKLFQIIQNYVIGVFVVVGKQVLCSWIACMSQFSHTLNDIYLDFGSLSLNLAKAQFEQEILL